jgi:hypothetical protein
MFFKVVLLLPEKEPASVMTIGFKALHSTSVEMTWVGVVPLSKFHISHYFLL